MRINKISVTNLFGIFNHEIPLNMGDRITIIHGPNGFGKTILLRMINDLFNSRDSELYDIFFTEFRLDFEDSSFLMIVKPLENKKHNMALRLIFSGNQRLGNNILDLNRVFTRKGSGLDMLSKLLRLSSQDDNQYEEAVESILPLLKQSNFDINETGIQTDTPEEFSERQGRMEKLIYNANATAYLNKGKNEPYWFSELKQDIKVPFIEAQRLINISDLERPKGEPLVETYAEELAEIIQDKLAEYAALSQSLDRTFPARLVQKTKSELTEETLRNKLSEIENQRSELIEAGLLGKDDNTDFQVEGEIDEPTKRILSVYIEDVEKKLSVFEDIAKKIQLLQRIIKDRFKYKKMAVSRDKGFTFTTHDGNPLAPADLSSGEQHQLVMLYELLFKVEPNSLILIDEPELSLHLGWQVQFLKDLQEITKLGNFDVLLATHSPDIISDRWDLTVELKGPIV